MDGSLASTIAFCKRCLYPSTKPDLFFEGGVCSACRAYDRRKQTDWPARKRELEILLERGRNGSGYDCIVPSSGGKDSHWQVLTLIAMGARPLVVTAATCHLTPIGRANIDNLARYATTIEVTPNRRARAALNRIGLKWVGDISYPEHAAIFGIPFKVACDLGIPLIFYGECPQEAYGGPPGADEAREMTLRWVQEYGGLNGLRLSDCVGEDGVTEADTRDYLVSAERVKAAGVTAYFLGQFYEWDSRRNASVAKAAGMRWMLPCGANWWEFENLDNAQTGLHDHMMYRKFGFGRMVAQLSVDIRAGVIARAEAVEIARAGDGAFPETYAGVPLDETLAAIGITRADLFREMDRHTNPKLFDRESGGLARRFELC